MPVTSSETVWPVETVEDVEPVAGAVTGVDVEPVVPVETVDDDDLVVGAVTGVDVEPVVPLSSIGGISSSVCSIALGTTKLPLT